MSELRPKVTLLYHYFHPDDVVSARQFSDLAQGLCDSGWEVVAHPCPYGCHDEKQVFQLRESWNGIRIDRVWRPRFAQKSNRGRLLNAAWMIVAWSLIGIFGRRSKKEVVIIGTDPVVGVLAVLPWAFFRRRTKIVFLCHDLYPEAPIAEGMVKESWLTIGLLKALLAQAYRRCSLLVNLGSCMGALLAKYGSRGRSITLPPWALVEPDVVNDPDPTTRKSLFGDASLGLLYSGNFGMAHSATDFLSLARRLSGVSIHFSIAARGQRVDELRNSVTKDDTNISFAGFAPESELEKRLGACDLHLVSLRPEWTGTVVPSKFFGALAIGRGVIFAGSPNSAIAHWIEQYRVGWVLTPATLDRVAEDLKQLARNPSELIAMRARCHRVYQEHFSKTRLLERWDQELHSLIDQPQKSELGDLRVTSRR